jgi:hypothetical protein
MVPANSLLHFAALLATPVATELLFDQTNKILLLHFPEKLTRSNFERVDALLARFSELRGPVDIILDFREVSEDIDTSVIVARAHVPSPVQDRKRVFIISGEVMYGVFRMYGMYQAAAGFNAPKSVNSLESALATLGADKATFETITLDGL